MHQTEPVIVKIKIMGLDYQVSIKLIPEALDSDELILAMVPPLKVLERRVLQASSYDKMHELCTKLGVHMSSRPGAYVVIG